MIHLVGKGGSDGRPSSPKAMESKDVLVGKGGPDGRPSSQFRVHAQVSYIYIRTCIYIYIYVTYICTYIYICIHQLY